MADFKYYNTNNYLKSKNLHTPKTEIGRIGTKI